MQEKINRTFLLKDCKLTSFLSPYIESHLLYFQNSNFSTQGASLFLQDQLVATLGPSLNGQDGNMGMTPSSSKKLSKPHLSFNDVILSLG